VEAPAIIRIVLAVLGLVFGSGFVVNSWRGCRRIRIRLRHAAIQGSYEVEAEISNAGEKGEHLTDIRIVALNPLRGPWTTNAIGVDTSVDLPARGQPARHTFELPREWIEQRSRFRVEATISSRKRPFQSNAESLKEAVLNVLEAP
jgi:hypothetical protein